MSIARREPRKIEVCSNFGAAQQAESLSSCLLIGILYTLALCWLYLNEISPNWDHQGFSTNSDFRHIVYAACSVGCFIIIVPRNQDLKSFLVGLLMFFFFIPSIVVHFMRGGENVVYFLCLASAALIISVSARCNLHAIRAPVLSAGVLFFALVAACLISLGFLVSFGAHKTINFNLADVYEFRRGSAAELPEIMSYVVSNVSKVVWPAAAILALLRRRYIAFTMLLLGALLLFSMTHHKSVLFMLAMALALFVIARRGLSMRNAAFLPLSITLVCFVESAWNRVFQNPDVALLNSYLVRRGFFVPPLLDQAYIDFFKEQPKYYWSTSRMGLGFVENPYEKTAPFLVGEAVFGKPDMSANTGIIGSGFSQAGIPGVMIYSLLTGILIAYLNACGRSAGHALVVSISAPVILAITTSTDFTTALLSHGLILLLLILTLLPNAESWKRNS